MFAVPEQVWSSVGRQRQFLEMFAQEDNFPTLMISISHSNNILEQLQTSIYCGWDREYTGAESN